MSHSTGSLNITVKTSMNPIMIGGYTGVAVNWTASILQMRLSLSHEGSPRMDDIPDSIIITRSTINTLLIVQVAS
jgi:hypothetical protein